jgi:hypothetical protein
LCLSVKKSAQEGRLKVLFGCAVSSGGLLPPSPPAESPPQQGWSSDINAPVAGVLKQSAYNNCDD